jgi:hypothetical protein
MEQRDTSDLISEKDMAVRLKVRRETLRRWRLDGCPHARLGRRIFYRLAEVYDWGRRRVEESEAAGAEA